MLWNMANAWKEKGNIDRAIYYYLRAIELRPNFSDAWSNLACAYMRKGQCEEAINCCHQALALNPGLVDAHSNLDNLCWLNFNIEVTNKLVRTRLGN
ncbi:probable UDP-N-acetylglucosamine--peptide N-acetylglucosaminyltransferase SEC [Papaver somniferum]|uniref:probable UDP-N-acetylglucosamine--peptide N-acetylglucosaminyltransferase SEC n=1 Tax=Papaver somniferum TaxID=3469 RepID=UPI000E6FA21E|nr:probable UDP-N-acetylglucosamine--peptide N-acetylglucosaminyltransferase SEC [Papaver somniferum]